ncbi:MAG: hypothetical protein AB7O45_10795, partial [Alphaproteobacteria bacterium]
MADVKVPARPLAAGRLREAGGAVARHFAGLSVILRHPTAATGLVIIALFIVAAILAPVIAPYGPFEVVYGADRAVVRLSPPAAGNWLGTTNQGMDVLSQLLWGSRVALAVGLLSALGSVMLGTLIGLA